MVTVKLTGSTYMAGGSNATGYNDVVEHIPPYYEVVWIMRVKWVLKIY